MTGDLCCHGHDETPSSGLKNRRRSGCSKTFTGGRKTKESSVRGEYLHIPQQNVNFIESLDSGDERGTSCFNIVHNPTGSVSTNCEHYIQYFPVNVCNIGDELQEANRTFSAHSNCFRKPYGFAKRDYVSSIINNNKQCKETCTPDSFDEIVDSDCSNNSSIH